MIHWGRILRINGLSRQALLGIRRKTLLATALEFVFALYRGFVTAIPARVFTPQFLSERFKWYG
jgi:hypothetical protein